MKAFSASELKFILDAGATRGLKRIELDPLIQSLRVYTKHLEPMILPDNVIVMRIVRRDAVRARKHASLAQRIESAAWYLASRRYVGMLRCAIDHALAA